MTSPSMLLTHLFAYTILLHIGCEPYDHDDPTPGDGCPLGATCARSPTKLFFSGAKLGDELITSEERPLAIAEGGTQRINVWLDELANMPFNMPPKPEGLQLKCSGANGASPPAFCALDSGLGVLSITMTSPPTVTIKGDRAGQDQLRIVATYGQTSEDLHDRINLDVVSPSAILMHVVTPPEDVFVDLHGHRAKDMPISFAVGSKPTAVVVGMFTVLRNKTTRVADESLSFANLSANLIRKQGQWDSLLALGEFQQSQKHVLDVM